MDKKEQKPRQNEILRDKVTIGFASMIEVLFLLLELYFIIHAYGNFQVMIIIAICMAAILFFMVMSILNLNQRIKAQEREEVEEIYRAQKATYLATKRYFDEIGERISALEENTNFPADDIISAQKAVAKVTISRNKENADALMNSNDEVIQTVLNLQEQLTGNNEEMIRQQSELMEEKLGENNRSLQSQFDALSDLMTELQNNMAALEQKAMSAPAAAQTVYTEPTVAAAEPEDALALDDMPDIDVSDFGSFDEELPDIETMAEEPQTDAAEEEMPDIDALLSGLEETEAEMAGEPDVEMAAEPEPEPIPEPELIVEPEPPMPDLSGDPNKQLSADEIAALFANASSVTASEEAPSEPAAEEPVAAAPLPDLSGDPNKTLSPEEIAALFANV